MKLENERKEKLNERKEKLKERREKKGP